MFLLESPYSAEEVWNYIPDEVARQIIKKRIKFYVIDAIQLVELKLGARITQYASLRPDRRRYRLIRPLP